MLCVENFLAKDPTLARVVCVSHVKNNIYFTCKVNKNLLTA